MTDPSKTYLPIDIARTIVTTGDVVLESSAVITHLLAKEVVRLTELAEKAYLEINRLDRIVVQNSKDWDALRAENAKLRAELIAKGETQ